MNFLEGEGVSETLSRYDKISKEYVNVFKASCYTFISNGKFPNFANFFKGKKTFKVFIFIFQQKLFFNLLSLTQVSK